MSENRSAGWTAYYDATAERPPRRTLIESLARFPAVPGPRNAVDLGCGDGRDTIELLRRGWEVLAIDSEPSAIERLPARADLPSGARLEALCQRFEEASWPAADLVNASFALPLCPPDRFPALWARILASLKPGGRFSGQLYGPRDSWFGRPGLTHHDRISVEALLADMHTEILEEEESDALTPRGQPKHWHIFHIVARRRGGFVRRATRADLRRIAEIRGAVRENVLIDPGSVTDADVLWFIDNPGIWLWDEDGAIHGFSAADPRNGSIWALFVDPGQEGRGIGRALLATACDALRDAGHAVAILNTGEGTRAERFYRAAGWREVGRSAKGELILQLAL